MKIDELEKWFEENEIPKGETMLFPGTVIVDPEKFLKVSILTLEANPDAKSNAAIWHRLKAFKLLIESNI